MAGRRLPGHRATILRGSRGLRERRLRAPALAANSARNARAERSRRRRWAPARDALWDLLSPRLEPGARIAIIGAGNGDDLPLRRIAERGCETTLFDLDFDAIRHARKRVPRSSRWSVRLEELDVSDRAADLVALAALRGVMPRSHEAPLRPLPGSPYDLVVGDLFYSQLLYPAMSDLEVEPERREAYLDRFAPALVRSVVARMHASVADGLVLHLHDPLAWWEGHEQPVSLSEVMRLAAEDTEAALALAALGRGPIESDPRLALVEIGVEPAVTAFWGWPFAEGVDYLVCASLVGAPAVTVSRPLAVEGRP